MTTTPNDPTGYRISIVDEDPLRARKEARELLAEIADADPGAALDIPRKPAPEDTALGSLDKGGLSVETIGVLISAGSLAVAGLQLWLSRVPQRTIIARRPDGATLQIRGRDAREDDGRIERFFAANGEPAADNEAGHEGDDGDVPTAG
ncbi:hypothetical protein QFW82_16705 [Streptomyces malaysiensis subsp. malaysiensis]|uniref:hypothetical protein n=1 Tax=Streptomyces malaysiensis TaxID=92644 RepID=UPI0024BF1651|nr:hypothetical protein [Streptomyces sp. NA07423]WHX18576.1 hypothetical protein QFW82_16705 [Streptomyces sp. NA07423]